MGGAGAQTLLVGHLDRNGSSKKNHTPGETQVCQRKEEGLCCREGLVHTREGSGPLAGKSEDASGEGLM